MQFLQETFFFSNSLLNYLIAVGLFILVVVSVTLVEKFVVSYLLRWLNSSKLDKFAGIANILHNRLLPITYFLAIYAGVEFLKLTPSINKFLDNATIVLITISLVLLFNDVIKLVIHSLTCEGRLKFPSGVTTLITAFIWIVGLLILATNLGYNVSTLIAGLGIGGIAIALASQAVLGDLFNYFVILIDKPFTIGDTIQVDNKVGVVEYIGIKSTRLRSNTGELLLMSNTDLTKSRIHNYKVMDKRRCLTTLGVEYSTSEDKLKQLPKIIQEVVERTQNAEFARVHFAEFGNFSLNFELAFFVLSNDYIEYTKCVQAVNYGLVDAFAKLGVNFAFPTQTIFLNKG